MKEVATFKKYGLMVSASIVTAALVVTSLAAAHWHEGRPIPANVHPLVMEAVRNNPHQDVSVIVGKVLDNVMVEEAATKLGARITARWNFINAFAAQIPGHKVPALALVPGVRVVLRDNPVEQQASAVDARNLENAYNYAVRADKVWDMGYNGYGVTVAIVDSGITDLKQSDFGSRVLRSVKSNSITMHAADRYGHGTHVAGIVAGSGATSDGKHVGVAPAANLINVKFSDDEGRGSERDLVSALQWIHDNRTKYNIRVANISANVGTTQSYRESAVAAAVEQLWFSGVVVVVSAGNRGGEACSVCYAPASDPFVITVGAVDDNGTRDLDDDSMKSWSSLGSTLDAHAKPDVVAPGSRIVSYMPLGNLRTSYPEGVVNRSYFRMGGTSMSAPVVSGVVALMLQINPELTPDQVKWLLMTTARTYQNQPADSPGIVAADKAAFYTGTVGRANQGLSPSPLLTGSSLTVAYTNVTWSNVIWSNTTWSNSITH